MKNQEKKYNLAVVGATGLVGRELLNLLENFPINTIKLFASEKSKGQIIKFGNEEIKIDTVSENCFDNSDIIFFCAGSKYSKIHLPIAQKQNALIIDLSSAFRMDKDIPLVIPEINAHVITKKTKVIASPNCTTTIMLMPLFKLHKEYKIKRIIASTYQAASGGGIKLMQKLENDTLNSLQKKENSDNSYGFNLYLHDSFLFENRYSEEEIKMDKETKKILEDDSIKVSATCVRAPVVRSHSISMNVEFKNKFSLDNIYSIIEKTPNVTIFEDFVKNRFATPLDANNKKETLISRIRLDPTQENTLELWAVGDQLLKGAALNAYQIAQYYIENIY